MATMFYGKLYAANYDTGTETQEIVDFYLGLWAQFGSPGPVLELMCGTGLNLIRFLEAGAEIDGLDSSPYMLALCQKKLDDRGLEADLYEQTIQDMALPKHYNFIFIPDRSFGHIYDRTMAQHCLKRFWEHMMPGGILAFDVKSLAQINSFGEAGQTDFEIEDQPDGSTVFSTGVWGEVEEGCVVRLWNKYEKYMDSKLVEAEIFDYRERLYQRTELEEMLAAAGFHVISVTKSYEHTEPGDNDDLVFICRKA